MTAARLIGRMAQAVAGETIEQVIAEAVSSYRAHFGIPPLLIAVHPQYELSEYQGIPVVRSQFIRPGHALAGTEAE